jgi:hypothetical protein
MDALASYEFRYQLFRILLAQIKLLAQYGCETPLATHAASRESSATVCL